LAPRSYSMRYQSFPQRPMLRTSKRAAAAALSTEM
jgi:hypothetical protein